MKIFRECGELQQFALESIRAGKRIGLVPTMGYLHAGHLSLIDEARKRADLVIVSIFVNPTQFGPNEDLAKYPRDFERDAGLCRERGADAIFAPEPGAMYEADHSTWVEETVLSQGLCGATRPGHFRGVTTVVAKLFNLAQAQVAVFGQKDAQQALVIRRMARDLNFPIEIVIAPLIRDRDGVALSSRNAYLSPDERERARVLSRTLFASVPAIRSAGAEALDDIAAAIRSEIEKYADAVDYVEILDAETLRKPTAATAEVAVLLAARFGKTRLIDNTLVTLNWKGGAE